MSSSRYNSHRPPFPTVEEILSDFNYLKNSEDIDPVLVDNELEAVETLGTEDEQGHEKDSTLKELSSQQKKEICNTYNKVAEFLEQNENLGKSIKSMNELSKELCLKKENLNKLILNIKQNMEVSTRETFR